MQPQPFGKYTLFEPLAAGGMGEVFLAKAGARGVERTFAVKRILTRHAHSAEFNAMLMREAQIAIALVHPNIAQIFEFGECEGHFFLAMEYVDGMSLAALLSACGAERRLAAADALSIGLQLCRALDYAHAQADADGAALGIVHRDVSPQNVLIDTSGTVKLIDFGIAKAADSMNLTETGLVRGKVAYMSPEQSRGEPLDPRDDIFAVGVMLFECLTHERLYGDESSMKVLARLHERDLPEVDRRLPDGLPASARAALKAALAPRREDRIANAGDLERELSRARAELEPAYTGHGLGKLVREFDKGGEARRERGKSGAVDTVATPTSAATVGLPTGESPPSLKRRLRSWMILAPFVLVLAAALAVSLLRAPQEVSGSPEPLTVLIANFDNRTGDDLFDGSLEQALHLGIEGASFITAYRRGKAVKQAKKLEMGDVLDEKTARLIAVRQDVGIVLAGSIRPAGAGYELETRAIDAPSGAVVAEADAEAADKAGVLSAVNVLAAELRKELGDESLGVAALKSGEAITSTSLVALKYYTTGQDLALAGKDAQAIEYYTRAVAEDPGLARAHSGWGLSAFKLGRSTEAEEQWNKALSLLDRMTDRERYRTLGLYYTVVSLNYDKSIENFAQLVAQYPSDSASINNLMVLYTMTNRFEKAKEMSVRLLELYPERMLYHANYAQTALWAGDLETALSEANQVLKTDASFYKMYMVLALVALVHGNADEAVGHYETMASSGPRGASLAQSGLADIALAEGRGGDAVKILAPALATDRAATDERGAGTKAVTLAHAHASLGERREATALLADLGASRNDGQRVPQAELLVALGETDRALEIADGYRKELRPQARAYALVIDALVALEAGEPVAAVDRLKKAVEVMDLWLVRFYLARAYLAAGHPAEAVAELELCVKRRTEATNLFFDDVPTWRYAAALPEWQRRAKQALRELTTP